MASSARRQPSSRRPVLEFGRASMPLGSTRRRGADQALIRRSRSWSPIIRPPQCARSEAGNALRDTSNRTQPRLRHRRPRHRQARLGHRHRHFVPPGIATWSRRGEPSLGADTVELAVAIGIAMIAAWAAQGSRAPHPLSPIMRPSKRRRSPGADHHGHRSRCALARLTLGEDRPCSPLRWALDQRISGRISLPQTLHNPDLNP
jgi:hypothetical protein